MYNILITFAGLSMLLLVWGIVQRWTAPQGNIRAYQYRIQIEQIRLQREIEKTKKVRVQLKIEQEKTKRMEMRQIKEVKENAR